MAKRGRKRKSSASWFVAAQFLISVRDELGWEETDIDLLVERLVGAKATGRRSRFFERVVKRGQDALIPESTLSFQKTMEFLYEYPEFSALATRYYRPIFHLIDALTVRVTAKAKKAPRIKPPGIRNIAIHLNDALEDAKRSRMTLDDLQACQFGMAVGHLTAALSALLDPDQIGASFRRSLVSMAKDVECPYKQLNLVALLSIEAGSVSDFRVQGALREFSKSAFESCRNSAVLDRKYLNTFQAAFQREVFERVRPFKQNATAATLTRAIVGSPLMSAVGRDSCERWRNAAFSRYAQLVEKRNEQDLFCWNKSWLRSFEGYLKRRGLVSDDLVRRYHNNEFKNPPRPLGLLSVASR